jgi:hypothetical protein
MTNLIFSTLAIYFLVLPGLLLQGGYSRGGIYLKRNRRHSEGYISRRHPTYPVGTRGVTEEIFKAFIAAIILHMIWGLICLLIGKPVDYLMAYKFVLGSATADDLSKAFSKNSLAILGYFISINLIAPFAGRWFLHMVREKGLDLRYKLFRFEDPWHYLIRGEVFRLPEYGASAANQQEPEFVMALAIMGEDTGMYAYSGYVRDWELNSTRDLDRLILSDAAWMKVEPGGAFGEPTLFPSDLLVLRYSNIQSLSFVFVKDLYRATDIVKMNEDQQEGKTNESQPLPILSAPTD